MPKCSNVKFFCLFCFYTFSIPKCDQPISVVSIIFHALPASSIPRCFFFFTSLKWDTLVSQNTLFGKLENGHYFCIWCHGNYILPLNPWAFKALCLKGNPKVPQSAVFFKFWVQLISLVYIKRLKKLYDSRDSSFISAKVTSF